MNLNSFALIIQKKEIAGTSASKKIRKLGNVPVILNQEGKSECGYTEEAALSKAISSKTLFNKFTEIEYDGKKKIVFAKVLQRDPVTEKVLHVDFQVVDKKKEITMLIPLKFVDRELCEPLKLGGILNVIHQYLPIIAKPEDMPEFIEYSLKGASGKNSIKTAEVIIPDNCKLAKKFQAKVIASILASRRKGVSEEEETKEAPVKAKEAAVKAVKK